MKISHRLVALLATAAMLVPGLVLAQTAVDSGPNSNWNFRDKTAAETDLLIIMSHNGKSVAGTSFGASGLSGNGQTTFGTSTSATNNLFNVQITTNNHCTAEAGATITCGSGPDTVTGDQKTIGSSNSATSTLTGNTASQDGNTQSNTSNHNGNTTNGDGNE